MVAKSAGIHAFLAGWILRKNLLLLDTSYGEISAVLDIIQSREQTADWKICVFRRTYVYTSEPTLFTAGVYNVHESTNTRRNKTDSQLIIQLNHSKPSAY